MRILTTTVHGAEPADMIDLTGPVAIIIGSEGNEFPTILPSTPTRG